MNVGEKFHGNLKRISLVVSSLVGPSRQTNCGSVQRCFNGSQIMVWRRNWWGVVTLEREREREREREKGRGGGGGGGGEGGEGGGRIVCRRQVLEEGMVHPHPSVTMYTR